jgi:hypothetical protein
MEYSDLFIALMRAQGVPARAAFGYGFDARTTGGEDIAHQWAEVYLPAQGTWIGVDTTWGENGPAIIGGDLNHIYKYIASKDPHTPAPLEVSFLGGLSDVASEAMTITAVSSIPSEDVMNLETLQETYGTPKTLGGYITMVVRKVSEWVKSIEDGIVEKLPTEYQSLAHLAFIFLPLLLLVLGILLWRILHRRRKIVVNKEVEKKENEDSSMIEKENNDKQRKEDKKE